MVACFSTVTQSDSWLVDSVCTDHMTGDKKLFKNLDKSSSQIGQLVKKIFIVLFEEGKVPNFLFQ